MTAKVYVTLKKAVLDPQGKAVERSLAQLGLRIGSLKHFLRRPAGRALPSISRRRPRGPPGYRERSTADARPPPHLPWHGEGLMQHVLRWAVAAQDRRQAHQSQTHWR